MAGCIYESNTSVTLTLFSCRPSPFFFFESPTHQWFIVINVPHIKHIWLCVAIVSDKTPREYVIVLDFNFIVLIYHLFSISCCISDLHDALHDRLAFQSNHTHWFFLIRMLLFWVSFPSMCLTNFIQAVTLSPFTIHLCYCALILNSQSHCSDTSTR